MNKHFLNGFIKAAKDAGVPDEQIASMLEQQQGNPEHAAHEAAETPEHEAAEHAGGHEEEIEHLLSQLSPEELEQLVQEISQMQGGEAGAPEGADQIPAAAAGIEQQLSNHPAVAEETAPQPNPDEATLAKQSAINFIKSANYIEGFLEQAMGRGMGLKQAVELYDSAFTSTFNQLKQSELIGNQKKIDVNHNGKIDGDDLKKLREGKKENEKQSELIGNQKKIDVNHNGKIDGDDLKKLRAGKKTTEVDEKTAAYYEGVLERAREYGLSDAQALQVVKEAMEKEAGKFSEFANGAWNTAKTVGSKAYSGAKTLGRGVKSLAEETGKTYLDHPFYTAAAIAGGSQLGKAEERRNQNKDKE